MRRPLDVGDRVKTSLRQESRHSGREGQVDDVESLTTRVETDIYKISPQLNQTRRLSRTHAARTTLQAGQEQEFSDGS